MTAKAARIRQFASDNYSGICPEAFAAMGEANQQHEVSYGNDRWTEKASNLIREVFETDCEVFFVFNGTSANSLSLASLCQSYHSILCHEMAHVEGSRSEEHTSELQSHVNLVCRLLLEKKKHTSCAAISGHLLVTG